MATYHDWLLRQERAEVARDAEARGCLACGHPYSPDHQPCASDSGAPVDCWVCGNPCFPSRLAMERERDLLGGW